MNNDICYMQYGDFTQSEADAIANIVAELNQKLSDSGSEVIKLSWDTMKDKIISSFLNQNTIEAKKIPIPTILTAKGRLLSTITQKKYKSIAISSLIQTVEETGTQIEQKAKEYMEANWGDPKTLFEELFNSGIIGVELKRDRERIQSLLALPTRAMPRLIELDRTGFSLENFYIQANEYLKSKREYAIASEIEILRDKLLEEYNRFWPAIYETEKRKLSQDLFDAEECSRKMVTDGALLTNNRELESAFQPKKPGGGSNKVFYLYFGAEKDADEMLKRNKSEQNLIFINQTIDNAYAMHFPNLIVLKIFSFDCDAGRLEDLLPSVEI